MPESDERDQRPAVDQPGCSKELALDGATGRRYYPKEDDIVVARVAAQMVTSTDLRKTQAGRAVISITADAGGD